jgi:hypothetical protein
MNDEHFCLESNCLKGFLTQSGREYWINQTFNLLNPTGYVTHQQVLHSIVRSVFVFCIYLITNSDLCHLQHKLIGFYNREGKCLLRGTDWVFK